MASLPVQFYGKDAVLQAFRLRGLEGWAVWQGKYLTASGIGEDMLLQWLTMLENSSAVYILKVYAGIENSDDIDEALPANGSFVFKNMENQPRGAGGGGQLGSVQTAPAGISGIIQKKLEAKVGAYVDRMLDKIDLDDDGDDEKPQDLKGVMMGFLDAPEKIPQLIQGVQAVLSAFRGGAFSPGYSAPQQQQPLQVPLYQEMQGVGSANSPAALTDEQRYARIGAAVERLSARDALIIEHLEMLATLAENKPAVFAQAISMLEKM